VIWQERTVRIDQIPNRADWLSAGERDALRGNRGSGGARLVAKQLLAESFTSIDHYSQIHIESRDGRDRSTCPRVYLDGQWLPWNVSLAHSDRIVSAAIVLACQGSIGIDLVDLASLSVGPLKYWLTSAEAGRAADRLSMGMTWSLKEAIYKASGDGAPFFPRRIDTSVFLSRAEWSRIDHDIRNQGGASGVMNNGWELSFSVVDETIKTLVCRPAARRAPRMPA
jgi:hypothetical protein